MEKWIKHAQKSTAGLVDGIQEAWLACPAIPVALGLAWSTLQRVLLLHVQQAQWGL